MDKASWQRITFIFDSHGCSYFSAAILALMPALSFIRIVGTKCPGKGIQTDRTDRQDRTGQDRQDRQTLPVVGELELQTSMISCFYSDDVSAEVGAE